MPVLLLLLMLSTFTALVLSLLGMTGGSCTQVLDYCKTYIQILLSVEVSLRFPVLVHPLQLVFHLLNRYPYGHEELAVCEDIDQVS